MQFAYFAACKAQTVCLVRGHLATSLRLFLEQLDLFIKKKRYIGELYNDLLSRLKNVQLPLTKTDYAKNIYWIYGIVLRSELKINAKEIIKKSLLLILIFPNPMDIKKVALLVTTNEPKTALLFFKLISIESN